MFADFPSPAPADLTTFLVSAVAVLGAAVLGLTAALRVRELFFAAKSTPPITQQELDEKLSRLKVDLMNEINRPNLNYVTQEQLERRMDKLETSLHRKIDEGGVYEHERAHVVNNSLHALQLEMARVSATLGVSKHAPARRGPEDLTRGRGES